MSFGYKVLGFGSGGAALGYITAEGGTIITCGDFKTHAFTGPGTFSVTAGGGPLAAVDYFVVAGAGGGASSPNLGAGGGGGGGFRVSNSYALPAPSMSPLVNPASTEMSPGSYPITVGGGGTGGPYPSSPIEAGGHGSDSVFDSITSAGGGGAKSKCSAPECQSTFDGGSGGGGSSKNNPAPYSWAGGSGNTPPVACFPQGNDGGTAYGFYSHPASAGGGGGGGAGAVGSTAGSNPSPGGPGGAGSFIADGFSSPTCAPSYGTPGPVGSTRYFSGGGGAGVYATGCAGTGGAGGGGAGTKGSSPSSAAVAGTVNTGGGGGGGSALSSPGGGSGKAGGSGVVMIRYQFQ